jgi:hypothetical protein
VLTAETCHEFAKLQQNSPQSIQGDHAREKNSTENFYLTAKEAKRAKKESVSEGF